MLVFQLQFSAAGMGKRSRRDGFVFGIGKALEVGGERGDHGGIMPRLSGDETRQAVEEHGEDRLIGGA